MSKNEQDKKAPVIVEKKHGDRKQEKSAPQVAELTGLIVSNTFPAPSKPDKPWQAGQSGKSGEGSKQEE
jgi:hypothetical protein